MNHQQIDALRLSRQHAEALRQADVDRRVAIGDFWRGADDLWTRLHHDASARLHRSARRLQARLDRRVSA